MVAKTYSFSYGQTMKAVSVNPRLVDRYSRSVLDSKSLRMRTLERFRGSCGDSQKLQRACCELGTSQMLPENDVSNAYRLPRDRCYIFFDLECYRQKLLWLPARDMHSLSLRRTPGHSRVLPSKERFGQAVLVHQRLCYSEAASAAVFNRL